MGWRVYRKRMGREGGKAAAILACRPLWTAPSESCSGAQYCQSSPGRRGRWCEIVPWWQSAQKTSEVRLEFVECTAVFWPICENHLGHYLLKTFCYGGDGWHSTGDGWEHVAIRSHRAVKVPLLQEQRQWQEGRFKGGPLTAGIQSLKKCLFLTTASRTMILATWSGWQIPEVSEISLVSRG